ncbi:hypothetical protein [Microbacterium maritypicum]
MTDTSITPERTALETAEANATPPKKRSKALPILLAAGALLLGGILMAPAAQAHIRAAVEPTVTATDSLAAEAQALTEQYEAVCQAPALAEAEALTAGSGSGEAFDEVTAACTGFAVENAGFIEKVEAATDLFTGLGESVGEVTDTVRAAAEAGDIEEAIHILFAQSETEKAER